jgi:hypothetical protein
MKSQPGAMHRALFLFGCAKNGIRYYGGRGKAEETSMDRTDKIYMILLVIVSLSAYYIAYRAMVEQVALR